jgi:RNA:NAD 2'-phosphotransferase (TPT1/KptA family)
MYHGVSPAEMDRDRAIAVSKFLSFVLRHEPTVIGIELAEGGWVLVDGRGNPIVLEILAADMSLAGHEFFVSANGVWLTLPVPPRFIR